MNFVEILAHQDMSLFVKQGVNFGLFGLGMTALGTAKHHEKYLSGIMSGNLLGGFGMTELGGGSDVQNVGTEAVYDHLSRSFVINTPTDAARKAYIGNAAKDGEMMIVFAQLKMEKNAESQGVHAFLVPVRDKQGQIAPGVTIEDCGHKIGLNGVDNGYLSFSQVRVPYDAMLDRFASIDTEGNYKSDIEKKSARFFKMINTLVTGRVAASVAALSCAKNALATAVEFADKRVVFGTPLLDKQSAQSRLLPRLADAYAMHFATRLLIDKHADNAPDLETLAAALKSVSSDKALDAIDEARCIEGGAGYMADTSRYGALRNDIDIFRTFEGDNTVLRLLVARNRLTERAKEFEGASAFRKAFKAATLTLHQKTSTFDLSKGSARNILDPSFQLDMFAKRESAMLYELGNKIRKNIKKAGGFRQSADLCQDDMLAYADAYAEKAMLEEFVKAVEAQKDPEVKQVLKDLCDLFAVNAMNKHAAWYLESDYMKPAKTKALKETAQTLAEKLRPQACDLVRAFAVPKAWLAAPGRKQSPQTRASGQRNKP